MITVQAGLSKNQKQDRISKTAKAKSAAGMAQLVKYLPSSVIKID
jgi:hypothetical protein